MGNEEGFEWLNEEICKEYFERARRLGPDPGENIGAWKSLAEELQVRCNLTEVQAYNILRGIHVNDYLTIYGIKSGKIPMPEKMRAKLKKSQKSEVQEQISKYEERIQELESLSKYRGSEFELEEKE